MLRDGFKPIARTHFPVTGNWQQLSSVCVMPQGTPQAVALALLTATVSEKSLRHEAWERRMRCKNKVHF